MKGAWKADQCFRTTKCFGSWSRNKDGSRADGAFPNGFLKWVKDQGWWGDRRVYLCAGLVDDPEAVRVDIRPEMNPTHLEDARNTSLPDDYFDVVIIDPPYSRQLAKDIYDTERYYSSINQFTKEAARIVRGGGSLLRLPMRFRSGSKVANLLRSAEFIRYQ